MFQACDMFCSPGWGLGFIMLPHRLSCEAFGIFLCVFLLCVHCDFAPCYVSYISCDATAFLILDDVSAAAESSTSLPASLAPCHIQS